MNFEEFVLGAVESIAGADYNLLGTLLGIVSLIFWVVVISWIWVDSGERTTSRWMRVFYAFIGIIPVLGWIIYLIVRPPETIDEIYWGDLERRYLKYETSELNDCPRCATQLYPGYIYCPNCKCPLKTKCPQCEVYVSVNYKYCTTCGYQMKKRAVKEEIPSTQTMQKQIDATKEEAHQSVKAKKSRYKIEINFVGKIGESVIKGYKLLGERIKKLFEEKPVVQKPEVKEEVKKVEKKKEEKDLDRKKAKAKKKRKKKKKKKK
ncbi:hypothetical protein K8R20_00650 [bacterium]|nr:hypothetical protein [bacterium]